jgi:hypothetical protein
LFSALHDGVFEGGGGDLRAVHGEADFCRGLTLPRDNAVVASIADHFVDERVVRLFQEAEVETLGSGDEGERDYGGCDVDVVDGVAWRREDGRGEGFGGVLVD